MSYDSQDSCLQDLDGVACFPIVTCMGTQHICQLCSSLHHCLFSCTFSCRHKLGYAYARYRRGTSTAASAEERTVHSTGQDVKNPLAEFCPHLHMHHSTASSLGLRRHTPRNTLHTTWDIEIVKMSLSYLIALQTLLARAPTFIVHLPEI